MDEQQSNPAQDPTPAQENAPAQSAAPVQSTTPAQTTAPAKKPTSGMAIAGLVMAIIAVFSAFVPLLNLLSFPFVILGIIFSIVGIVGTGENKKSGRPIAIVALVLSVLALIVTLAMYGGAASTASNTNATTNTTTNTTAATANSSSSNSSSSELAVGQSATLDGGLTVTVKETKSVTNYDGSALVAAYVEYVNSGSQGASYNVYDWKGETSTGSQEYTTYYSGGSADALNSGTLSAGGTVSGWVYFKTGTVKALYFSSAISNKPSATWTL